MRQDVEEIGKLMGVHYALNAVLNSKKQIVQAFAGDPLAVIHEGIKLARKVCQTPVRTKYDLIIASPGGSSKRHKPIPGSKSTYPCNFNCPRWGNGHPGSSLS